MCIRDRVGTVTITVSYEGKETTFEVTVSERPVIPTTLKNIEITKVGKVEYKVGESFTTEGLEVTAYYTDGSSKVINDYQVSGFSAETEGEKVITVSYAEGDITATASFTVTIVAESGSEENPEESQNPDTSEKPEDSQNEENSQNENTSQPSSEAENEDVPATGDSIGMALVILAGLCSLAGMGILLVVKRKIA